MKKISPKLKTSLPKLPNKPPKPQVPGMLKPLGGGTQETNPAVTPRNSAKGVKQRAGINLPGIKTS